MSDDTEQSVNGSGNGLAEGSGAANPGPPMNETSPADAGLPFGTGSQATHGGRPVPHPYRPKPMEHVPGSVEPDHEAQ